MDPNEALATLRQLVVDMEGWDESGEDPEEPGEYYRIASEAVRAFDGLDDWLSQGGFLPQRWMPPLGAPSPTEQQTDERMAYAMEKLVLDCLKDVSPESWRHMTKALLAQRIGRAVVEEWRRTRELMIRMADSSATRQFVADRVRQLSTAEPVVIRLDADGNIS